MYISIGLLYALIPIFAGAMIGFVTWLVTQIGKHAELIATATTNLNNHDDRLKRLEGFQDGFQFGRSIEQAHQSASRP